MTALYTILLGNPELKKERDAPSKTRFKMWWRLIGSAVEHAAKLHAADKPAEDYPEIDFQKIFIEHEETEDEDSTSLADALGAMLGEWPKGFHAADVAELINNPFSPITTDTAAASVSEPPHPVAPAPSSLPCAPSRSPNKDAALRDSRSASITLREFLYPGEPTKNVVAARSVGKRLKAHVDEPVKSGECTLILKEGKTTAGSAKGSICYHVEIKKGLGL